MNFKNHKKNKLISLILTSSIAVVFLSALAPVIINNSNISKQHSNNNITQQVEKTTLNSNSTIIKPSIAFQSNVLPQTLSRNDPNIKNKIIANLKNEIIAREVIFNPTALNRPLTSNDFDVSVGSQDYDNTTGTATASIVFKAGTYFENGVANTNPITKKISITNLMKAPETIVKKGVIYPYADSKTKLATLASLETKKNVETIVNENPELILDNPINFSKDKLDANCNWLYNTKITIDSFTRVDDDNGTIDINASVQWWSNGRSIISQAKQIQFKLGGYLNVTNNKNFFTTTVVNTDLKLNNLLPQDITTNNLSLVLDAIVKYNAIKNTNITAPALTKNDISIDLNDPNYSFNNKLGTINCKVIVKNNKAWKNNIAQQEVIFEPVIFSGFKTILPTQTINTTISIGNYNNFNTQTTDAFTTKEATTFVNQPEIKNLIFSNLPSDSSIDVINIDNNYQANGLVKLSINVTSYYDTNSSWKINTPFTKNIELTIKGFKNSDDSSTVFNTSSININQLNSFYCSDINDNNKKQKIIELIKNELVSNATYYFSNLNKKESITANDIKIKINDQATNNLIDNILIESIIVSNNKAITNNTIDSEKVVATNIKLYGFNHTLATQWLINESTNNELTLNGSEQYFCNQVIGSNQQKLEKLINENISNIVTNTDATTHISVISVDKIDLAKGIITATISLDKYYDNNGLLISVDPFSSTFSKQIVFNNFKSNSSFNNTILKLNTISYNQPIFKDMFGNNKGFVADWSNPEKYINSLIDHPDKYVNHLFFFPTSNTKIINDNNHKIKYNFDLEGNLIINFSYLGNYNHKDGQIIDGQLKIILRQNPISNGSDPNYSLFVNFKKFIEENISVKKIFPRDTELADLVVSFLNKNQNDLPDAWLPTTSTNNLFTSANVKIDSKKIVKNDGAPFKQSDATIQKGAITVTVGTNEIIFPTFDNILIPTTYLKQNGKFSIANDQNLSNLTVDDIINTQSYQNDILNWMDQNINDIFANINTSTINSSKINHNNATFKYNEIKDCLEVTFNLDNSYTIKGIEVKSFTISLSGFLPLNDLKETKLLLSNLNYYDQADCLILNSIFKKNNDPNEPDKGFINDWAKNQNYLTEKAIQLEKFLKDNINNPNILINSRPNTRIISVTLKLENNIAIADVTYSGIDKNLKFSQNINSRINIFLKSLPVSASDSQPENIYSYSVDAIENFVKKNHKFPSIEELKKIIISTVNNNINLIPDEYCPTNQQLFDTNMVNVVENLIEYRENDMIIKDGAIVLNAGQNQSEFRFVALGSFKLNNQTSSDWNSWLKWVVLGSCVGVLAALIFIVILILLKKHKAKREW